MDPSEHEGLPDPPEEFVDQVREALLSLYDPSALEASPLLVATESTAGTVARIQQLRRSLLDTIDLFQPKPGVPESSRAWRIYRILELRYIERHDVSDVMAQVALSKSQYHREHHYALQAVARLLWKNRPDEGIGASPATGGANRGRDEAALLRREVDALRHAPGDAQADLADVLRGVGEILHPLARKLGIDLRIACSDQLPRVPVDRVALRQALLLILRQVARSGGGHRIQVGVVQRADRIDIVIDPDWPSDPEGGWARVHEARPFVDALGATLALPGGPAAAGDAIRLSLPVGDRPALLVVDNHPDFPTLVSRLLAGQGWEVIGAADVDLAFHLAAVRHPRAILLDIIIPGRDGWDLLARLKESPETRDLPVIICSILDESEIALELGAAAYLRKPIDRERLREALEPHRRSGPGPGSVAGRGGDRRDEVAPRGG